MSDTSFLSGNYETISSCTELLPVLQVGQMFCQALGKFHSADSSLSLKRMRRRNEECVGIDSVTYTITCEVGE